MGCGFIEGIQKPVYATISLDLNMKRVEKNFLKKLKANNSNPIGADACHLPIRSNVLDKIYWRAVLEHLPTPELALMDGRRSLKKGGKAKIVLPIITNHLYHFFIILFTQFPFSIYTVVISLWQAHKLWRIPGVPHIKDVKPHHLEHYFSKVETQTFYIRHKWFHTPWGHITLKFVNHRFIPDIQGQYHIRCIK